MWRTARSGAGRPGGGLVRHLAVAGTVLALLIGAAFAVLLASINDLRDSSQATSHSLTALAQSAKVEDLVLDVEAGQRGYVITHQDRFLDPWRSARAAFPSESAELVRDSGNGQRVLALRIQAAGTAFINDYSVPLVRDAQRGAPSAHSAEATERGKILVDAMRARFARYDAVEKSLIDGNRATAETNAQDAIIGGSLGLGGSILLIGGFAAYLTRSIVWPVRRAAAVANRLADGDLSVRMPETGRGEIGELQTGFNVMAGSLERSREQARLAHERLRLLYDASMSVGTALDVEQTAKELVRVAVGRFADFVTVDVVNAVLQGEEPSAASGATRTRRLAVGGVRDDSPLLPEGTVLTTHLTLDRHPDRKDGFQPDLAAAIGWRSRDPEQAQRLVDYGLRALITAPLATQGALLGEVSFWRAHDSPPFQPEEVADAEELAVRAAVAIDNARRYRHERSTALTLQRSLLPERLPGQPAVQVATRYLPSDTKAGVGGDWFDVIPLSGTRVALVVGDVVGHGIHASATMGRLRTAVRTLADVDLPPDELLTHLDDLVIHLDDLMVRDPPEDGRDTPPGAPMTVGEVGATCLYAVYDPVSRHCTFASAGHPTPVVVAPTGRAELVEADVGPPLGVGGEPFAATDLHLYPGTVLALYTDGLVQSRRRDIGEGLARLRQMLTTPPASLDDACQNVIDAMLPEHPEDDVTLMLVRTRALRPDHAVTWQLPSDPAAVGQARQLAADQLEAWRLGSASFVTELVVSELVTNAIRYGEPPIQLRLIRDTVLICEVFDASSTAPHMRRARVLDEGGRGLLLVAQLTQRWGTRPTPGGKAIWCEQPLPAPDDPTAR